MSKLLGISWLLLPAIAHGQDLAETDASGAAWDLVRRLEQRIESLEAERESRNGISPASEIDLSGEELPAIAAANLDHVLARPWYENVRISGYGAFTYLDTGGAGTATDGSFLVKEASLFLQAEVWERTFFFSEIVLTRFPGTSGVRIGELNLQFTGLFSKDGPGLGLKLGRFEIPFGEEYLLWDAHETPFITFSAADPYGVDEGIEVYGELGGVHWIAAVTNGAEGAGADDGAAKLVAAKLYGEPHADLYCSASALASGGTELSAFRLSGNSLAPVGDAGASALGASPSDSIDIACWQVDCRLFEDRRAGVALNYGQARLDDVDPFDRGLQWWQVTPRVRLHGRLEAHFRYSEIRTDDSGEGYRFSGKPIAQGESLGYDARSLRRLSAALCWTLSPHVVAKLEVGHDWLELIDPSPFDEDNDERLFSGLELVASF